MTKMRLFLLAGLLAAAAVAGCRSAHTTAAILYIDQQKYDKAIDAIHEGFQYRDNEPDAYFYLGEAYSNKAEESVDEDRYEEAMKNYGLAYEAYQKAIALDPEDWKEKIVGKDGSLAYNYRNRIRQAQLDWNEGYYEQAEGHLRLAYAAWPDSVTPIKSIARMKMQMAAKDTFADQREELLSQALNLLDQILASKPEAYELRVDKANVLDALGRDDEARTMYEELLAQHGNDTHLLLSMADLAREQQDYSKSADYFVKVVDLNEGDTDAGNDKENKSMLVQAGVMYGTPSVGRYADAVKVLDRAANMEINPEERTMLLRLQTYFQYGMSLVDKGQAETDPAALQQIKDQVNGLFQRAVEIGNAMTNLFPTNADGFFYLSAAQFQLGDYDAATVNNKTYEELSGNNGE